MEASLQFETPDRGEEDARADLYGLLAVLFYQPPSNELLESIASAPSDGEGALPDAWRALQTACRDADPESARDEYESLFVGVGKPEVFLYGSYYLAGFLMEKPLAQLRSDLLALGLEREDDVTESEDHISSLCEVMRHLISTEDVLHGSIATQKQFFAAHIQPWVQTLCDTILRHPEARFHAPVAQLAQAFFAVEMQAFDMVNLQN
ncbi:TorD/DmsD family molecular chaperone [Massilia endophytica]|uniref:TorD/DmsD family molecular chaperone n=1 Tax=Massilia endophytica TaxID=2899220 RepID=UPI001E57A1DF|nr:molecular chaperone [Massilia endophytica]UGQ48106.1 molecular chaperone [Massilia endophytica]